jgi:hypothetical protein
MSVKMTTPDGRWTLVAVGEKSTAAAVCAAAGVTKSVGGQYCYELTASEAVSASKFLVATNIHGAFVEGSVAVRGKLSLYVAEPKISPKMLTVGWTLFVETTSATRALKPGTGLWVRVDGEPATTPVPTVPTGQRALPIEGDGGQPTKKARTELIPVDLRREPRAAALPVAAPSTASAMPSLKGHVICFCGRLTGPGRRTCEGQAMRLGAVIAKNGTNKNPLTVVVSGSVLELGVRYCAQDGVPFWPEAVFHAVCRGVPPPSCPRPWAALLLASDRLQPGHGEKMAHAVQHCLDAAHAMRALAFQHDLARLFSCFQLPAGQEDCKWGAPRLGACGAALFQPAIELFEGFILHFESQDVTAADLRLILAAVKRRPASFPAVTELNLSRNAFGDEGAAAIAEYLAGGGAPLELVTVAECGVTDAGVALLEAAQPAGLRVAFNRS